MPQRERALNKRSHATLEWSWSSPMALGKTAFPMARSCPEVLRLHEAACVRLSAPGTEPHDVEHVVAVEEVVPRAWGVERVRAVADIPGARCWAGTPRRARSCR